MIWDFCDECTAWHFATKVRSCEIGTALKVQPRLGIERSQLRWFGHVPRIFHEGLVRNVLLALPTGKGPIGHPRPVWSDCISDLVWSRLIVEPAELSEIPVDRDVFPVHLLFPRPFSEGKRTWKWMRFTDISTFQISCKNLTWGKFHVGLKAKIGWGICTKAIN